MKSFVIWFVSAVVLLTCVSESFAAKRVALVIGNSHYKASPLENPANDAGDMAAVLRKLGFDVILKLDADLGTMKRSLRTFQKKLTRSEIGLFYYAGHGMQIDGKNYLIPVKNNIQDEWEVADESLSADRLIAAMKAANNPMNIVILDACRDNPFKRSFRSAAKGLSQMDAPLGTVIAYATSPGSVAADGRGRNGTYTEALLKNIQQPGMDVQKMFNQTGMDVINATNKAQVPWISTTPFKEYYLAGGSTVVDTALPQVTGKGSLMVESRPSGAQIYVNGESRGRTPVEVRGINPGRYSVEARLAGHAAERKSINVNPGRKAVLSFILDPVKTAARLFVTTEPSDSRIRILNIQPAYYNGIRLEKGRYHLEVSKPGFQTHTRWVSITDTQDIDLYVELEKETQTVPSENHRAGDTWTEPITGMKFVWVPKGCFQMGSNSGYDNEKPVHEVCVDGFWMAKYEVTNRQFRLFRSGHDSKSYKGVNLNNDDQPVVFVAWNDAKAFIQWLNSRTGQKFALPTDAQWEYAARGGTTTVRFWGNDENQACQYANVHDQTSKSRFSNFTWPHHNCSDGYAATAPVGRFKPNPFGLHDMLGNVWEWCEDVYDSNAYGRHSRNNPLITSSGYNRVRRGGSRNGSPANVRCALRSRDAPTRTFDDLGFRLIRKP